MHVGRASLFNQLIINYLRSNKLILKYTQCTFEVLSIYVRITSVKLLATLVMLFGTPVNLHGTLVQRWATPIKPLATSFIS